MRRRVVKRVQRVRPVLVVRKGLEDIFLFSLVYGMCLYVCVYILSLMVAVLYPVISEGLA